jgi:hypothetical protein
MARYRWLAFVMVIVAVIAFAQYNTPSGSKSSASFQLQRLRTKLPVRSAAELPVEKIAGQYTSTSEELHRRVGGFLSGDDLYLFPDGTYIYSEWADIQCVTIYDKGTWAMTNGLVELKSGPEVTWIPKLERQFLLVRRKTQLVLVGIHRDLDYFEENAGDDPETMLYIVGKVRDKKLDKSVSAETKATLIQEAWRPEYFSPQPAE